MLRVPGGWRWGRCGRSGSASEVHPSPIVLVGVALGSRCSLVCFVRSAFSSLRSVAGPLLRGASYLSILPPTSCRAWASFLLDSLISSISWSASHLVQMPSLSFSQLHSHLVTSTLSNARAHESRQWYLRWRSGRPGRRASHLGRNQIWKNQFLSVHGTEICPTCIEGALRATGPGPKEL